MPNPARRDDRARRIRTLARLSGYLSIVSVTTAGAALVAGLFVFRLGDPSVLTVDRQVRDRLGTLEARATELGESVALVSTQIEAISTPPEGSQLVREISDLDVRVQALETPLARLENAISNEPSRALEVPLLRRDLDNLSERSEERFIALQSAVNNVYDLSKWLLGAITVSIITLAIGFFLRGRSAP